MKNIRIILAAILVTVLIFSICSCEKKTPEKPYETYEISKSDAVSSLKQNAYQQIVYAFDFVKSFDVDWGTYNVTTSSRLYNGKERWHVVLKGSASGYVQEEYGTRYTSDRPFCVSADVEKTIETNEGRDYAIRWATDIYTIKVTK